MATPRAPGRVDLSPMLGEVVGTNFTNSLMTRPSWPVQCAARKPGPGIARGAYFVSFFGTGGGEPSNNSPPVTCLTLAAG